MDTFIARQPIFDRQERLYAYELLFRSGLDNIFTHPDPDQASAKVMADSLLLLGLKAIIGGKRAFINVTRHVLVNEYAALFPKATTVVEILETVEEDPEVILACRSLKKAGYLIALDDFSPQRPATALTALADIIKVDFLTMGLPEQRAMVRRFAPAGIRLLAEKVETYAVFREAMEMEYTYFQGYFFAKPAILRAKGIPEFKLNYLRMLGEILRPEVDFKRLEAIIRQDVTLSYKLLRYINSAFFGLRSTVHSILDALLLVGEREIKKWVALISMASMSKDKPEELVVEAAVRARFCETLAPLAGLAHRAADLFLIGLFSLIDAILDQPLPVALQEIPLADDVRSALLEKEGSLGGLYECALAYMGGDWQKLSGQAARLGIDEAKTPQLYRAALEWAERSFALGPAVP